jgi:hypothetical protein
MTVVSVVQGAGIAVVGLVGRLAGAPARGLHAARAALARAAGIEPASTRGRRTGCTGRPARSPTGRARAAAALSAWFSRTRAGCSSAAWLSTPAPHALRGVERIVEHHEATFRVGREHGAGPDVGARGERGYLVNWLVLNVAAPEAPRAQHGRRGDVPLPTGVDEVDGGLPGGADQHRFRRQVGAIGHRVDHRLRQGQLGLEAVELPRCLRRRVDDPAFDPRRDGRGAAERGGRAWQERGAGGLGVDRVRVDAVGFSVEQRERRSHDEAMVTGTDRLAEIVSFQAGIGLDQGAVGRGGVEAQLNGKRLVFCVGILRPSGDAGGAARAV